MNLAPTRKPIWWPKTGSYNYNLRTAYNMQYIFSSTPVRNKVPTAIPSFLATDITLVLY